MTFLNNMFFLIVRIFHNIRDFFQIHFNILLIPNFWTVVYLRLKQDIIIKQITTSFFGQKKAFFGFF